MFRVIGFLVSVIIFDQKSNEYPLEACAVHLISVFIGCNKKPSVGNFELLQSMVPAFSGFISTDNWTTTLSVFPSTIITPFETVFVK